MTFQLFGLLTLVESMIIMTIDVYIWRRYNAVLWRLGSKSNFTEGIK